MKLSENIDKLVEFVNVLSAGNVLTFPVLWEGKSYLFSFVFSLRKLCRV